jgi:ABC-type multidrug transport system fused ATPase/permease subunit
MSAEERRARREVRRRRRERKRAVRRRHRRSSQRSRVIRWTLAVLIAMFVAVVHWLLASGYKVGRWATGVPHTTIGYVPVFLVIFLLIVRDLDSIAFGGLRLDMRRTRDEMASLTNVMQQRQSQGQNLYVNDVEAMVTALAKHFPGLQPVPRGEAPAPVDPEVALKLAEGEVADTDPWP